MQRRLAVVAPASGRQRRRAKRAEQGSGGGSSIRSCASAGPVGEGTPAPDRAEPAAESSAPIVHLRHARAELALHELRSGPGTPLLLLHGLAERSPDALPPHLAEWPGPVFALDFVGHGDS